MILLYIISIILLTSLVWYYIVGWQRQRYEIQIGGLRYRLDSGRKQVEALKAVLPGTPATEYWKGLVEGIEQLETTLRPYWLEPEDIAELKAKETPRGP